MVKMEFQFGFVNNDGVIELEGDFPKKMSLKQAIRFSAMKYEFILGELLAGCKVTDNGATKTCALCWYSREIKGRYHVEASPLSICHICPISHKVGNIACNETPEVLCQPGSLLASNVRKQVKFLKALEAEYA